MCRILKLELAAMAVAVMLCGRIDGAVVNLSNGSTSGYTMTDGNTYVINSSVSFSNDTAGGSGMAVADGATVVLYVPADVTLTTAGANGSGTTGGGAGIRVPATSTLIITGEGALEATGGDAGSGANGGEGRIGSNGDGGDGGGGGGAALGGIGGSGGVHGTTDGNPGNDGEDMGVVFAIGQVTVHASLGQNGGFGSYGAHAEKQYVQVYDYKTGKSTYKWVYSCGGGGGGGAGAIPQLGIGGGGSSGGAGGRGNGSNSNWQTVTGAGGESKVQKGQGGTGCAGGAAGAEGDAGTLYVSPTATVDVDREKLSATTHPAAQYTITFDANGGRLISSVESLTATLGCELPDSVPTPMRNCYAFDGWRTVTGEEYYSASGAKSISSYPVASNVVLYAQWEEVAHTTTTPVPVPHSYFDTSCPTLLAECGGDYEATGLASAKNGCNKVWECYVAGISPTNVAEKFTAQIELNDGVPVVTWNPDKKSERDYKIWGSTNLVSGGSWECPTNSSHRFFKVTVDMP